MVEVDWVDPLLSVILLFQTLFGFVVNLYVLIFVILTKQVKHFGKKMSRVKLTREQKLTYVRVDSKHL